MATRRCVKHLQESTLEPLFSCCSSVLGSIQLGGDHNDTALHLAVSHNYRDVVEALIAKRADVNACDSDGDTPLQWAVESGRAELVKIVFKQNENTGEVVLHWAVKCGHIFTELLLANKADISLIDLTYQVNLQRKMPSPS